MPQIVTFTNQQNIKSFRVGYILVNKDVPNFLHFQKTNTKYCVDCSVTDSLFKVLNGKNTTKNTNFKWAKSHKKKKNVICVKNM